MAWGFCITVPVTVDGRFIGETTEICIAIPVLPRRFPPDPPEPPWIRGELLRQDFVRDLEGLAAIDEVAAGLSSGLKSQVQRLVRTAAKESKLLPANFDLKFDMESHRS